MKNIFYSMILLLFVHQGSVAQVKPGLPPNFYDGFRYKLPDNFNYNDSIALNQEIVRLSAELSRWNSDAFNNYTIADSTDKYNFLVRSSGFNMLLNQHQQSADAILSARKLRPTPDYITPFGLVSLAYSKACLVQKDDGSTTFADIFSAKLIGEFKAINSDFRNDIVNQNKGGFTPAVTEVWWKNVTRTIDQSIKNANGMLNFANANLLITAFQQYILRKRHQLQIEKALYAVSPAKVQEQVIKIPMRDGIRLNAFMYRDELITEKLPVIVSLSPYPTGSQATRGNVFATNGYVFVYVDTRGRRESEGSFLPYEDDARDYYDIIDWLSKQPWCDGQVATSGGSYLGFDQWQAIRKKYKHPALKAINPAVSVGFGVDFPRKANMFYPYMLRWAVYVSGKDINTSLFNDSKFWNGKYYELYKNRLPFSKLDSVAGMPNPYFQKWISHPDYDSYWQNIMPSKEDYQSIDIPIFSITGYYDADQVGAMYYYDQHQKYGTERAKNNHYLLIGPYDHPGAQWQPGNIQNGIAIEPEAQIPIYKYMIWWYDWVLKGKQKPAFIKDRITYFETGNGVWKGTSSLQQLTSDSIELFLSPSTLSNPKRKQLYSLSLQRPGGNASIQYRHDIAMALDSAYFFSPPKPFDDAIYMSSAHDIVFESMPLQHDIVLSDKIIARIYASLNVPDADFEIFLQELDAEGKDRNIASGSIRVRYRNGGEKPQLAKPGEVVQLNFDHIFIYIKKIARGTRLRLVFQSINSLLSEKNYGFGGEVSKESTTDPRIIEANILMGRKYPSKVVLPISKN
jgi:putative CocE/NonD family hydrolase